MTWTLAAFAILAGTLVAGFAWYERTHPSSRTLALVATLAALAALGRVAFAPIPNVKPTTDVVIIAGFALGAAPGFAVGAVAALTSNLVFGEGPWTPWQMVGWGLCGLLGAGLARVLRGRDPGRLELAVACALGGAIYGGLLDFQEWLLYAPERTWEQYVVRSGSSFSFNSAHVIGNVVFALAFGPALIRMLARFKARTEIDWRPLSQAAAVLLVALLAVAAASGASAPSAQAASSGGRALSFLDAAQNRDGGWGGAKGQGSSALYSAWALMGQGAARNGRCSSAGVRYVQRTSKSLRSAGDLERTILALKACRIDTGTLGRRLAVQLNADGSFGSLTNLTSFGIFAFRATGASTRDSRVRRMAVFVARQQNRDGGFAYSGRGAASTTDDTAAALQALVAAGRSRTRGAVPKAVRWLRRHQRSDGGFAAGGASNAQSTAWAIQGFAAARVNVDRVRRGGSRSPLAYLRTLQAGDGSVRYSRTSRQTPVWVTAQALTGLARAPFPIR